jgi:hypothetical protein
MAEPSEVRAWARDQGLDVNARGAIPAEITSAYDAAHNGHADYPAAEDAGVTEADFPPPLDDLPSLHDMRREDPNPPLDNPPRRVRERKPRVVKPSPTRKRGWKQVFGNATPKAKGRGGPRTDLSEFAEDTWRDLALLASGVMPPVSRVLGIQAPYAGVVFDEAVRGLPLVDTILQPVARASVSLRALNGLLGPVVFTAGLCVQGEWVLDGDGRPTFGPDGRPVPTQRTAMMLGGLKYSLLQMSRTADLSKVQERAEVDAERMRSVDMLVDFIMDYPRPQTPAPATDGTPAPPSDPTPPGGSPGQVLVPSFVYPPPPQMDDTGARA